MLVRDIDIADSPLASDRVRLRAEVVFEGSALKPMEIWYEVSRSLSEDLSLSGNPWTVLLVPLATNLGEPLKIPRAIDPLLYDNLTELMQVWRCWYHLQPIKIEVDIADQPSGSGNRSAAFFSSGVDAWFTLIRHAGERNQAGHGSLDDLISVWGLDIPLDQPGEFAKMKAVEVRAADAYGLRAIDVATNLHETIWWRRANWGRVAHGCGLASIGLALERRYAQILIPSTHRYSDLVPWGSHPLTDPLLGTNRTKIVHDGAGFSRVEKTELLITSPMALSTLQVCWETKRFRNCGACTKCYRTMATLELLGALNKCETFDPATFTVDRLRRVYVPEASDRALMQEVYELAQAKGRLDVARAIARSVGHTRRLSTALRAVRWFGGRRFVWRFCGPLERMLLSRSVRE